jgi:hypothetical protein
MRAFPRPDARRPSDPDRPQCHPAPRGPAVDGSPEQPHETPIGFSFRRTSRISRTSLGQRPRPASPRNLVYGAYDGNITTSAVAAKRARRAFRELRWSWNSRICSAEGFSRGTSISSPGPQALPWEFAGYSPPPRCRSRAAVVLISLPSAAPAVPDSPACSAALLPALVRSAIPAHPWIPVARSSYSGARPPTAPPTSALQSRVSPISSQPKGVLPDTAESFSTHLQLGAARSGDANHPMALR